MDTKELKVGDKVRSIKRGTYNGVVPGDVGVVEEIVGGGLVKVSFPTVKGSAFVYMWSDSDQRHKAEIELVEDIVNRPDHYSKFPVEPITMIMLNEFEFWRGSIIKYASRAGSKIYDGKDAKQSEITDLQKIQRFAQMRINHLNGEDVI